MNAINAAWEEKAGRGWFEVKGRTVFFYNDRGWTKGAWHCKSGAEAKAQLKLFRAATKYPQTKSA